MNHALRILQAERDAIRDGRVELMIGPAGPEILALREQSGRELEQLERAIRLIRTSLNAEHRPIGTRRPPRADEIEPGRGVQNDWDRALFEPYAARKSRRAREVRP